MAQKYHFSNAFSKDHNTQWHAEVDAKDPARSANNILACVVQV